MNLKLCPPMGQARPTRPAGCLQASAPHPSDGFAMLEALVALLLFSIGILGLVALQTRAVGTLADTENRSRAALIADLCASQLQLLVGNSVSITGQAKQVAQSCTGWNIDQSAFSAGLPAGTITSEADPLTSYAVTSLGTSKVPLIVDIVVKWNPVADRSQSTQSQYRTKTTLLVLNN